jgi:hypothetical protein
MDQPELRVEAELQKINEVLAACDQVKDTVSTNGWVNIIEPLIDKAISDVTGAKVKGRWYGGLLDRAKKEERREYYIGYKQALIDFHRRIYAYVDNIDVYEGRKKELVNEKTPKYTRPMIDDTRYGRDVRDA